MDHPYIVLPDIHDTSTGNFIPIQGLNSLLSTQKMENNWQVYRYPWHLYEKFLPRHPATGSSITNQGLNPLMSTQAMEHPWQVYRYPWHPNQQFLPRHLGFESAESTLVNGIQRKS